MKFPPLPVLFWSVLLPAALLADDPPARPPQGIPEGKGTTTNAGKFIPAAKTDGKPAIPPEEAEKALREALKVEETGPGKFRLGRVTFDAEARTVSFPAAVHMRGGVIEYVLTTETGKAHEALLTTKASPRDVHMACLLLGMKAAPLTGASGEPMKLTPAESVRISVSWETNGPPKTVPLSALLNLAEGNPEGATKPVPESHWHYTGSQFTAGGRFAAETEGSFVSLIRDGSALVNNADATRDDDNVHVPNPKTLPPAGTPVTVILKLPAIP